MKAGTFDDTLCFEELGELICQWDSCDVWSRTQANLSSDQQRVALGLRRNASIFFRTLLAHHYAQAELSAALTLFDALLSKAMSSFPSQCLSVDELSEQASLAAIARLVLKCSAVPITTGPCVSAIEEKLGLGEPLQTGLITTRELHIWTIMAGRVAGPSLPGPGQWLCSVLQRLKFLVAPQPEQVAEFEQAMWSANAATDLLTTAVGMSSSFPPRVLALGGCVLGFIAVGAVSADQARPKDVSSSLWESVLVLWQRDHANQDRLGSTLGVDIEFVAEASCCSTSDLQDWTFRSAASLHSAVLTGVCNTGNLP